MLVDGDETAGNSIVGQQLPRDPRVLGSDRVHPPQDLERPAADVAEVPNRGGHYI
jgi:hypothetical protein